MEQKHKIFKIILWELLIPIISIIIFGVVFCIFYNSYYYLPTSIDSLISIVFDIPYIFGIAFFYFAFGMFFFVLLKQKVKDMIIPGVIFVILAIIIPLSLMIIKTTFFSIIPSDISGESFKSLLESDYYFFMGNIIRIISGLFFLIMFSLILRKILKKDVSFKKPYIIPNGYLQISSLIYLSLFLIPSIILFIRDTSPNIFSLIIEILYFIFSYFSTILGSIVSKKIFE